jgi:hypothetical protein
LLWLFPDEMGSCEILCARPGEGEGAL